MQTSTTHIFHCNEYYWRREHTTKKLQNIWMSQVSETGKNNVHVLNTSLSLSLVKNLQEYLV